MLVLARSIVALSKLIVCRFGHIQSDQIEKNIPSHLGGESKEYFHLIADDDPLQIQDAWERDNWASDNGIEAIQLYQEELIQAQQQCDWREWNLQQHYQWWFGKDPIPPFWL